MAYTQLKVRSRDERYEVRFDDRLMTVLSQPGGDRHDAAVRWRQLVDLVARAGSNSASPAVEQALSAIRSESAKVDEGLRAAAARAVAALPLPLGLLQHFASDRLSVSAPVLAAATLDSGQWRAIHSVADEETRKFIETLHPELKPASPLDLTEILTESPPRSQSLHEVVARIERRRRGRIASSPEADQRPPPPPGSPALFRWECGPGGDIAWVEGAPRGAMIGRSIARSIDGNDDQVDPEVVRAFGIRAPFRDALLTVAGEGTISGEWKISGVPAFAPADGRFAGYRGIALREVPPAPTVDRAQDLLADPDSVRELVHEIKTPLNAIIGFAEIIEGQYLGPADRGYRERAREIIAQARLLLTAIDDLDFAAKVHSASARPGTDVGELVERMKRSLNHSARNRGVELEATHNGKGVVAAVAPELADRLLARVCGAIIERSEAGERLLLSVDQQGDRCTVTMTQPAAMRGLSEAELFGTAEGVAGGCFSLRLARGLARIAGGDLAANDRTIALVFPRV